jgi:hypothetical protein
MISSNVGGPLNGMRVNVDKGSIGNKDSKSYAHTIDHYSYESYGANLTRGTVLHISLNAGKPVDLLVIDEENLTGYEDAVRNGEGRLNASVLETSVTAGNYEFTAPYRDDFYLIVDNTVVPEGAPTPTTRSASKYPAITITGLRSISLKNYFFPYALPAEKASVRKSPTL